MPISAPLDKPEQQWKEIVFELMTDRSAFINRNVLITAINPPEGISFEQKERFECAVVNSSHGYPTQHEDTAWKIGSDSD